MSDHDFENIYNRFDAYYRGHKITRNEAFGTFVKDCVEKKQKLTIVNKSFDMDLFFESYNFAQLEESCMLRLRNSSLIEAVAIQQQEISSLLSILQDKFNSAIIIIKNQGRFFPNLWINILASFFVAAMSPFIYFGVLLGVSRLFDAKSVIHVLQSSINLISEFSN